MERDRQEFTSPAREFSPPGAEFTPPGPEFAPPGAASGSGGERRKRRKWLLAAGVLLLALSFAPRFTARAPGEPAPPAEPAPLAAPTPEPTAPPEPTAAPTPTPEPTAAPTPTPEPTPAIPRIEPVFFSFSHEHHGRVTMENTETLTSVQILVRETVLDLTVYEAELSAEEIAAGTFELPELSTGDVYMEHLDTYDAQNAWPAFEMTVNAWYDPGDGSGETLITRTLEPSFELGFGLSYWEYDWDEQIPADCFLAVPWEEMDEIRYVINDPEAVSDPLTVSVDISCDGRHAAPEEYETILYKDEYDLYDPETGESVPTVSYTAELLLRRPAWMPEEGTVHVVIVQRLATTGELWTREFDLDYPPVSDW